MTLYLVRGKFVGSLYCGPTALCSITGLPSERIIEEIQAYRHNTKRVVAMSIPEMRDILLRFRYRVRMSYKPLGLLNVHEYCQRLRRRGDLRRRIIATPGHVLVTNGVLVYDTNVPCPVVPEVHPRRKSGVWEAIIVG